MPEDKSEFDKLTQLQRRKAKQVKHKNKSLFLFMFLIIQLNKLVDHILNGFFKIFYNKL